MKTFANFVIRRRKAVLIVFIALAVLSGLAIPLAAVNYDMADYLPEEAPSTLAIDIMREEFGGELPNARVMVRSVSVQEALARKESLAGVEGVLSVTWLDDVSGGGILSSTPVEVMDSRIVRNYYKEGNALFTLTIKSGQEKETVAAIRTLIGQENAIAGGAVNMATAQEMSSDEVIKAIAILLPVVIVILLLATLSWLEPLLFLAAVGIAVLINMGTNFFFGEMSYITQAVSPILQLAVSLDYAIFLLHSFAEFRKNNPPEEAMALAMKKSVTAVAASAATTVVGFLALLFMRFEVGADLGINLVKGVMLSFVSVMVFLPALTLSLCGLLDKARHRRLLPDLGRMGKVLTKSSAPFLLLALLIAVPSYLAKSKIEFQYGMEFNEATTRAGRDEAAIEEVFGSENTLVLLVPKGDTGGEVDLCRSLSDVPNVTGVVSYVTAVNSAIPPQYLSEDITSSFYSENYARIILYTDTRGEGAEAFAVVKAVEDIASVSYPEYRLAGQSATLYDMSTVVSSDTKVVNAVAIAGIFLVLLIAFQSPVLPVLLVFTIESAIWLNLSMAYFSGHSFNFIGYLVISTVQLGATVDYAILITDRFKDNRKLLPKREAMEQALGNNLEAVLVSAAIMSVSGFTLAATSSNLVISQLGELLGRGTVFSFLMVALVLPALLMLSDGLVQKTTPGSGLLFKNKNRAKRERGNS